MLPLDLPLAPMLARASDTIPVDAGSADAATWAYEPKWDGWRCVLARDEGRPAGGRVRLWSRQGTELTALFPELVTAADLLPGSFVLDGEVVIIEQGRLEYTKLSARNQARVDAERMARLLPATFVAFDLLALAEHALLRQPFRVRRELLETLLEDGPGAFALSPVTHEHAVARQWFEQFEGLGLDGVMAKRMDAVYEPGVRAMIKVKHRRTADVVVAAFRVDRTSTARHRSLGSLLVGLFDETERLQFVGVCSGFSATTRRDLLAVLRGLELERDTPAWHAHPWAPRAAGDARVPDHITTWREPRDEVHFISPLLVAEVAYDYLHGEERFRSNARFLRWRPDRPPASCRFDQLDPVPPVDLRSFLSDPAASDAKRNA